MTPHQVTHKVTLCLLTRVPSTSIHNSREISSPSLQENTPLGSPVYSHELTSVDCVEKEEPDWLSLDEPSNVISGFTDIRGLVMIIVHQPTPSDWSTRLV